MSFAPLSVVFFGSPEFAVPCLRAIHPRHRVLVVVTQPDRPQGRGQVLMPPPVKVAAQALGLPVLQPETLRGASGRDMLARYAADVFIVVAYGKIFSRSVLAIPPLGCINVHASLLPKYRGAAPIQWAVIRNERTTGISIMRMDAGMDTGPVLVQESIDLRYDETAGSLHDRLAPLGAELLLTALDGIRGDQIQPRPQDETEATVAPLLHKDDGLVNFSSSAETVDGWIRGMDPWPGAYTFWGRDRLKLFRSTVARGENGNPGEVLAVDSRGLLVGCNPGAVWIRELQLPGRKRLPIAAFIAGRALAHGTHFSSTQEAAADNPKPVGPLDS